MRLSLALLVLALAFPTMAQVDRVPESDLTLPLPSLQPSWDWLADTYWYVPQSDLPAYLYDLQAKTSTTVPDQTVFHIAESKGGYFRGTAVVQIGVSRTTFTMLGVVSPDASVLLNFLPTEAGGVATTGTGRFTLARREITMLNQMSSSPNERLRVLHWAYMMRTRPGDATWNNLPGVNMSVPQFLGN
jgi:hypothetical protein